MPENYRVQAGCHNCTHRFEYREGGGGPSPTTLFCTSGAPRRPLCGSPNVDEAVCPKTGKMVDASEFWDWSKDRAVEQAGVCDEHEPEPEPPVHDEETIAPVLATTSQ